MIISSAMALAALVAPLGQSVSNEAAVYMDVYEGDTPDVRRYELEGTLPGRNAPFVLRVTFPEDRPVVEFSRGNETVRVRLAADRFTGVPLNEIVVATRSRSPQDNAVIISIPYGQAQEDCFVNGDEVFDRVYLLINANVLESIEERRFSACQSSISTPAISVESGLVTIR